MGQDLHELTPENSPHRGFECSPVNSHGYGFRKRKRQVDLRLEPVSLFRQTAKDLEEGSLQETELFEPNHAYPSGYGLLTGMMMKTPQLREPVYNVSTEDARPLYGPLTAMLLESSKGVAGFTPRIQSFTHSRSIPDQYMSFTLPKQLPEALITGELPLKEPRLMDQNAEFGFLCGTAEEFGPSMPPHEHVEELETNDHHVLKTMTRNGFNISDVGSVENRLYQATVHKENNTSVDVTPSPSPTEIVKNNARWRVPRKVQKRVEIPTTLTGPNTTEEAELTNLDWLMTTPALTKHIVQYVQQSQSKRSSRSKRRKGKRTKPLSIKDVLKPMNEKNSSENMFMCQFADCCFNQLGIEGAKNYYKHVAQTHCSVKHVCYWCKKVFSRTDSVTRHTRLKHHREERKRIIAAREADLQRLIDCGFIVSSPEFLRAVKEHHLQLLDDCVYDRGDDSSSDSDSSTIDIIEEQDEDHKNQDNVSNTDREGNTSGGGDSSGRDLGASPYTDRAPLENETSTDVDGEPYEFMDKHYVPESLKTFCRSELKSNSDFNYVLATSIQLDHIRRLMSGSTEELVEGCDSLALEKGNKVKSGDYNRDFSL